MHHPVDALSGYVCNLYGGSGAWYSFMQSQTVISLKRYREIGNVLVQWGFGEILLEEFSPGLARMNLHAKLHPEIGDMTVYERMRHVLEEPGPAFVKSGQILFTRREMISRRCTRNSSKSGPLIRHLVLQNGSFLQQHILEKTFPK